MTAARKHTLPSLFMIVLGIMLLTGFAIPAEAGSSAKPVPVDQHKEIAKIMTHSFATGLGGVLANVKNEQDRINLIRSFIDPVRFFPDNSGYFYVYDAKCVNIAHAVQKDLQGKNLFDFKDTKGKLVIQALAEAAKKGGGFVDFYWVKPGTNEQMPKQGYVEPIPGTDYFIGTGVYLP
jgi:signal transduction histidine kinase